MSIRETSPRIACPELPVFDAADWKSAEHAFRDTPACPLHQTWREEPEQKFAPATVRVGRRDNTFFLLAELQDADIFTFAQRSNERLWELGDALEIFLRPADQEAYVEFHIAPNNLRLQLRFANSQAVVTARKSNSFHDALIDGEAIHSRTWVRADARCWHVLVGIPATAVHDQPRPLAGAEWRFSVCRYDYTRGQPMPVISSTSAHAELDFHRQHEWGTLFFCDQDCL